MQIGVSTSYPLFPAPPAALGAASPDVSRDLIRANQAPATPPATLGDEQSASAREEADRPAAAASAKDADADEDEGKSPREVRQEQLEVAELANRDQEVRAHEQAHAAVGGVHAGSPSYTYTSGSNGKRYATAGEVSIDVSPVPDDPRATLTKMETVVRAALAPAQPSAQDRQVAAKAQAQMALARAELAATLSEDVMAARQGSDTTGRQTTGTSASAASGRLDLYRRLAEPVEADARVDLVA